MTQKTRILSPALTPEALVPVREPAASAAVPFFPPDFSRIADYDPEIFSPEVGAVILPGHTTKFDSLAEVLHNPAVPILAFTPALYQELSYLTAIMDTEWAVFLTLKRLSPAEPHFLAHDWFMPLQSAHGGGVSVDAEDARRYYQALKEHPYYKDHGLHRHLCHLHSHVNMDVFFSATDNEQQLSRDDLGFLDDFRFYAVVNQKQRIKLSFVNYRPVLFRAEAVPVLLFSRPEYVGALTAERKKEIDARVRALVKKSSGFSVPGLAFPSRPRRKRCPDIPAASRAGAQAEAGAGSQEQKERPRPESIVALVDYLGEQLEKHPLGNPREALEKVDNNAFNPSSYGHGPEIP